MLVKRRNGTLPGWFVRGMLGDQDCIAFLRHREGRAFRRGAVVGTVLGFLVATVAGGLAAGVGSWLMAF